MANGGHDSRQTDRDLTPRQRELASLLAASWLRITERFRRLRTIPLGDVAVSDAADPSALPPYTSNGSATEPERPVSQCGAGPHPTNSRVCANNHQRAGAPAINRKSELPTREDPPGEDDGGRQPDRTTSVKPSPTLGARWPRRSGFSRAH
jgi:hypothetical protein